MEIWKDIPGMEGVYQVSNCGRIKALERNIRLKNNRILPIKEHFVKGSKDTKGYLQLDATIDGKRIIKFIHRLVAESFLENPKNFEQVNHKDGNKLNNCADNLEWCTCIENIHHAWKNGLNKPLRGEKHGSHKLTEEQVVYIKTHYKKLDKKFGARALAKKIQCDNNTYIAHSKRQIVETHNSIKGAKK